jgi:hypothetical protein
MFLALDGEVINLRTVERFFVDIDPDEADDDIYCVRFIFSSGNSRAFIYSSLDEASSIFADVCELIEGKLEGKLIQSKSFMARSEAYNI